MPADRVERRLAEAIWAASDALRAAAHDIEEYRGERGSHRRDSAPDRDPDLDGDEGYCAGDGDERCGAQADPPLPPYPPIPPYPPFPPYPPMPPIIVVCGCECRHGAGYGAGVSHSLNAGWPLPAFGPASAAPPLPVLTQATTAPGVAVPPFQPPSADKVPAGGISFGIDSTVAGQQPSSGG